MLYKTIFYCKPFVLECMFFAYTSLIYHDKTVLFQRGYDKNESTLF